MILIGWTVVYRNARRIASRNETFSLAGRVRDTVASIEESAASYYASKNDERTEPYLWEGQILVRIDRIRTDLDHLRKRKLDVFNLRLANLRIAALLDADQVSKMSATQKRDKITEVKRAGTELINELDRLFLHNNTFLSP
jgi:hypothetical protein